MADPELFVWRRVESLLRNLIRELENFSWNAEDRLASLSKPSKGPKKIEQRRRYLFNVLPPFPTPRRQVKELCKRLRPFDKTSASAIKNEIDELSKKWSEGKKNVNADVGPFLAVLAKLRGLLELMRSVRETANKLIAVETVIYPRQQSLIEVPTRRGRKSTNLDLAKFTERQKQKKNPPSYRQIAEKWIAAHPKEARRVNGPYMREQWRNHFGDKARKKAELHPAG
jgi:hypothetical protein